MRYRFIRWPSRSDADGDGDFDCLIGLRQAAEKAGYRAPFLQFKDPLGARRPAGRSARIARLAPDASLKAPRLLGARRQR